MDNGLSHANNIVLLCSVHAVISDATLNNMYTVPMRIYRDMI